MSTATTQSQSQGPARRRRLVRVGAVQPAPRRRLKRVPPVLPTPQPRPTTPVCAICCDKMVSKATLKCGHTMCASCLARHARNDHRCPFCREPYAPPAPPVRRPLGADDLTDAIVTELAAASVEVSRRTLGQQFGLSQRWLAANRAPAVRRERFRRVLEESAAITVLMVAQFLEATPGRRR